MELRQIRGNYPQMLCTPSIWETFAYLYPVRLRWVSHLLHPKVHCPSHLLALARKEPQPCLFLERSWCYFGTVPQYLKLSKPGLLRSASETSGIKYYQSLFLVLHFCSSPHLHRSFEIIISIFIKNASRSVTNRSVGAQWSCFGC